MTFLNQVILTGKVAKPPQFHHQPDGTPVVQFLLELDDSNGSSITPSSMGQKGQVSKRARLSPSLIHIVAMGQLAQSSLELQNGQHLLVKGRLHQRQWKTSLGRYISRTEVIASDLHSDEEGEAIPLSQK